MTVTVCPTAHPVFTRTMPCATQSTADARSLIRRALAAWGLDDLADDGALVVSELVANAVEHTASRLIRVTVSRPGRNLVRIAVVDKSRTPPAPRTPDSGAVGGRGLLVVEAVTDRWGTDLLAWGKRVWGELRREDRPVTARPTPWVGDEVHDPDADCSGIVTDVRSGTYVLRPLHGPGEWTSSHPERLAVVTPRTQQLNAP